MKSVCYTCLLALIFTVSAEASAFAFTVSGGREANTLNAEMPINGKFSSKFKSDMGMPAEIAKLEASAKINAINGEMLEEELAMGDSLFQKAEAQRAPKGPGSNYFSS